MDSPTRRQRGAAPPLRDGALAAGDGPRERLDSVGAEALFARVAAAAMLSA